MFPYRVRYQTIEFDELDIHIRSLRDKQQFSDTLGEAEMLGISSAQWSLFGVVWDSSQVLAHEMLAYPIAGKRVLEMGCGMALSSLLLNARGADITATDYHPEAGSFLAENTRLNNGRHIPFLRTSWAESHPGLGQFDVLIGADLLYEQQHIEQLSGFIQRHASPQCEIILVDPGRGHYTGFTKKMQSLGYVHSRHKPEACEYLQQPFKGHVLRFSRADCAAELAGSLV
jgi:predicted nicotinamide N-methyase